MGNFFTDNFGSPSDWKNDPTGYFGMPLDLVTDHFFGPVTPGPPITTPYSTMSPEQQEGLKALMAKLIGNLNNNQTFDSMIGENQYSISNAPGMTWNPSQSPELSALLQSPELSQLGDNPYGDQMGSALQTLLAGNAGPAYNINSEATEQYYQDVIRNPAMAQYEDTRSDWLSKTSNIHGSHRDTQERESREDLLRYLGGQRSNLYYQDEMARRQSLENAANRNLASRQAGLQAGMGMEGQRMQGWQAQNQMAQDQWMNQSNLQQSQDQMAQQQWMNQNQLGMSYDQMLQDQWYKQNALGQSASQLDLAYQQAQLEQQAQHFNMSQNNINQLLAALGLKPLENIVTQDPGALAGLTAAGGIIAAAA